MKKLTPAMQDVLDKMSNGWEMGVHRDSGGSVRCSIQQGGCCRGGQSIRVHWNTFESLFNRGLILENRQPADPYWLTRYKLTPAAGEVEG